MACAAACRARSFLNPIHSGRPPMLRWLLAAIHLLALGLGLGAVWVRARALGADPADHGTLGRALAADSAWGAAAFLWIGTGLWRLLATLAGAALGGIIATRVGIFHGLWSLGLVQLLSSLGYAAAAAANAGKTPITAAALFENFAAGLGTAAFLAFLMSVCERRYAATQFALLCAVFALSRWGAGMVSGVLAERLGFAAYFLLTFLMGLPAYLLLPRVRHAGVDS